MNWWTHRVEWKEKKKRCVLRLEKGIWNEKPKEALDRDRDGNEAVHGVQEAGVWVWAWAWAWLLCLPSLWLGFDVRSLSLECVFVLQGEKWNGGVSAECTDTKKKSVCVCLFVRVRVRVSYVISSLYTYRHARVAQSLRKCLCIIKFLDNMFK